MDAHKEVELLLKEYGGVQRKGRKHRVYKFSDGRKWTTPNTPSDSKAWKNNLGELKLFLGLKSSDKTHADFEHKKKEKYQKPVEQRTDFLSGIEREERPQPPPGPSLEELRAGQEETTPTPRRKGYRKEKSGKSGKAFSYSPEVLATAQNVLETQGQEAMQKYLNDVKLNGGGKREMESNNGKSTAEILGLAKGGELEALIAQCETMAKEYRAQAEHARLEELRNTRMAEELRKILQLKLAGKDTLRGIAASNGDSTTAVPEVKTTRTKEPRGNWFKVISEIIQTSPKPLKQAEVLKELYTNYPNRNPKTLYQVFWGLKKNQSLNINLEGYVTVPKFTSQQQEGA